MDGLSGTTALTYDGGHFDSDLIRMMVQANRGISNLYYNEAGFMIAVLDQDIFDESSANLSAMLSNEFGQMILGPCAYAAVYDTKGEVIYEVTDVYSLTGSGASATSSDAGEPELVTDTQAIKPDDDTAEA
jgi:hypothetical protein